MKPVPRVLVIAGALVIAAVSWLALQVGTARSPLHVTKSAAPPARPRPALARDVLASDLTLSFVQRRALQDLAAQWQRESTPLETAVGAAGAEFDRFASRARAEGHTSLAELQRHSAEMRELSAELRTRRQVHGDAVLSLLTDEQRRQLLTRREGGLR